jgi:hypothetical protein
MIRALLTLCAVTLVTAAAGQSPGARDRLQLVRCAVESDAPCLRTRLELAQGERAAAGRLDSAREGGAWTIRLDGARLLGLGARVPDPSMIPARLLILLDGGSGMAGKGIAFTRIALKAWLKSLDSTAVKVAVASLDARDLARRIADAVFDSPARAMQVVDAAPGPEPKAQSPLYSAMTLAAQRVRDAVTASPEAQGGVLLVTAGANEVGRGRGAAAAGLLAGPDGLSQAARAVAQSGQRIWIISLAPDRASDELRTLAGPEGSAVAVPLDPNALVVALVGISREFRASRDLTVGVVGPGPAGLARTALAGIATLRVDDQTAIARPISWRPPLMALPTFRGVADSTALPSAVRDALLTGSNAGGNRPVIALLIALLLASVWVLVPRLGWAEPASVAVAREPSATTTIGAAPPPGEAIAPRKPEDITHQTARRTAMHR